MTALFLLLTVWPVILQRVIVVCAQPTAWVVDWEAYAKGIAEYKGVA